MIKKFLTLLLTGLLFFSQVQFGFCATELDYMEYSSDASAQAAYVSNESVSLQCYSEPTIKTQGSYSLKAVAAISGPASWDIYDDNCSSLLGWTDGDYGNGVSEVSPAGQFHLYAGAGANGAYDYKDIGTYPTDGYTAEILLYNDTLGTQANGDIFHLRMKSATAKTQIEFCSDGLFVLNSAGSVYVEVGTNIVDIGAWTTWRFVVNESTNKMDIYKDRVKVGTDINCATAGSFTNGTTELYQESETIATEIHIDYFKVATGINPPGSLNKTLTRTIGSPIDLSDKTQIKFDIRSSRTGSNIKMGIRDSGLTTTETTPNITSANTWQTVTWDISGVSNANKDAIDRIIITPTNADAENTLYLDNMFGETIRRIILVQ